LKYRSTILYLVAALILGGIYFLDVRSEKEEETRKEEASKLFQKIPDKLSRLTIKRKDGTIVLERIPDADPEKAWVVTAPVRTGADFFSVNRITSLLPHLAYTRIVKESAKDLEGFGLADPPLVISWAAEDTKGSLSIGEESPIDKDFYAKTADQPRIVLLPAHNKEVLDKDLYDLRDKRLFTVAYDRVTRMDVEGPSGSWTLVKSGETTWALEGQPGFPVDSERVNAIVRKLSWEEAASFEQEEAKDLSPYGLDAPDLRIALAAEETREELQVGKAVDEGEERRYACMAQRPQVLTVKTHFLKDFPASPEDLRRKEPDSEETSIPEPEAEPSG